MATSTIYAGNNFQSVCNRLNGSTLNGGSNTEDHLPVGYSSSTDSRWRAIVKFPNISAGIPIGAKIVKAEMWIKTTGSTVHVGKGSNARMRISRLTQSPAFTGGSGEGWYTTANPKGFSLSSTTAITYAAEGNPGNGVVKKYDITDYVEDWLSGNYIRRDGGACRNLTNNGVEIKSYDENSATRTSEFWSTRGGYEPRLVVTYTTEADPVKPTITDPTSGDLLTAPTEATVQWAAGTGDEGLFIIGTTPLSSDVYSGSWGPVTPGASQVFDLSGVTWPVGQTLYLQARSRNDLGVVRISDNVTISILPVPTASLTWPGNNGRCHIWNLNDLAVWTSGGAHAKPRVTVGYTHPTGVASQVVEVRINGSTVHSFTVAIPSGGTRDLDIDQAMFRATDFTIEVRAQGGGGQWSAWSSPVTARVNFGQAILSFTHAAGASGFAARHAALAGGSKAQVAYAYKASSDALWRASLGGVDPDTSMDVLVRLSTSDAAQAPSLASLKVEWSEDPAPVPDFWEAVNADIELDSTVRRFGVHSLRVTPNPVNQYFIRVRNTDTLVVSPNTVYTMSVYVNTLGQSLSNGVFYLAYENEAGGFKGVSGMYDNDNTFSTKDSTGKGPENWQRLYATFKTGSDESRIKPIFVAPNDTPFQFRLDSFQLESGSVASSWRPGTLGPAIILDVGGIAIDGEAGGIFRARGSNGGVVTLGADGLELDGEPYITAADVPAPTPAPAPIRRVYTANATWTKPANLSYIEVEVQGAGGGAGGSQTAANNAAAGGAGGGGGGWTKQTYAGSALPATCAVVVGAGGNGGGSAPGNGTAGGASSFSGSGITTLEGLGGAGGAGNTSSTGANAVSGGLGGTASGGSVNVKGQDGMYGGRISFAGVASSRPISSSGGSSILGLGGAAATNERGNDGTGYGAGGGGAAVNSSQTGRSGGAGTGGIVIVTEYY